MSHRQRWRIASAVALISVMGLSACVPPPGGSPGPVPPAPGPPAGIVMAYHPVYEWGDFPSGWGPNVNQVPWKDMTHLVLGYWQPTSTASGWTIGTPPGFQLGWSEFDRVHREYVAAGHARGVKVMTMLGGAESNSGGVWTQATAPGNVVAFARNIATKARALGLDGVDLDWEDNINYAQFRSLANELRKAWPTGIITIPTSPMADDAGEFAPVANAVSWFMPMTYLDISQWGGWPIPIPLTPIGQPPRAGMAPAPYGVDSAVVKWSSAGVSPKKLLMGVGGFGSVWGDWSGDGRAAVAPYSTPDLFGPVYGEDASYANEGTVYQSWVDQYINGKPGWTKTWDAVGQVHYWTRSSPTAGVNVPGVTRATMVFYETPESIGAKRTYIANRGMLGMGFWTLTSLQSATNSYPVLAAA